MLLNKNPEKRLGSGPEGIMAIKQHAFFKNVDWEMVYKKVTMPIYIPSIGSQKEFKYFTYRAVVQCDKEKKISEKQILELPFKERNEDGEALHFSGFSFVLT